MNSESKSCVILAFLAGAALAVQAQFAPLYAGSSGVGSLGAPPFNVYAYKTMNQTLSGDVGTNITWNAEVVDTGQLHDNNVNTDRITVPLGGGGFWLVTANVAMTGGAGRPILSIFHYNSSDVIIGRMYNFPAPAADGVFGTLLADANPGDYFVVNINPSPGGIVTSGTDVSTRFCATLLRSQ